MHSHPRAGYSRNGCKAKCPSGFAVLAAALPLGGSDDFTPPIAENGRIVTSGYTLSSARRTSPETMPMGVYEWRAS